MTATIQNRKRRSQPSTRPTTSAVWTNLLLLLMVSIVAATVESYGDKGDEHYRDQRIAAKPWLMKEFRLLEFPGFVHDGLVGIVESSGLVEDPSSIIPKIVFVSPFTLFLASLVLANFWSWLSYHLSGTWVEASHILVKDTSPKTLKALVGLKAQLGKDAKLFGLTAKQYSQCPSAEQNGDLGRFGPGVMAPPFDKLCFDPATPVNETVGPVQTQFGYHLIYLRTRKF